MVMGSALKSGRLESLQPLFSPLEALINMEINLKMFLLFLYQ